jgi:hypothetical protein
MKGLRFTEDQLAAMQKRNQDQIKKPSAMEKMQALGRLKSGQMNKTEMAYEAHLFTRKVAGEVLWYKFEGMKFRLADNTFYSPDFAVMLANGQLEQHEVKGYMMEDANLKLKFASEIYPFKFIIVKKIKGGGFSYTEV